MSDAPKPADALYVPAGLVYHPSPFERARKLADISRPLLGLAPGVSPIMSPHEQIGDVLAHFVRKSPDDSKLYPTNHPKAGQVRHDWADGPDGIRLGHSKGD